MGQCLCSSSETNETFNKSTKVALKLPHGLNGLEYNSSFKSFVPCTIQSWLSELYKHSKWTNWVAYNDQNHQHHTKKGHCKGIFTWNDTHVSWLCHSVPYFPKEFTGTTISDIDPSEQIYGQSFHYYECAITKDLIKGIFHQLYTMNACPIIEHYTGTQTWTSERLTFRGELIFTKLVLADNMVHLAKSPNGVVDIYSQCLAIYYPTTWKVESWIRGHEITTPCPFVKDIDKIFYKKCKYKESQDHSKWAVSDKEWYWVGDLNRTTSQFHRGGGGFVGTDQGIANAFRSLIQTLK